MNCKQNVVPVHRSSARLGRPCCATNTPGILDKIREGEKIQISPGINLCTYDSFAVGSDEEFFAIMTPWSTPRGSNPPSNF